MKFTKLENYTDKVARINLGLTTLSVDPSGTVAKCRALTGYIIHDIAQLKGCPAIPVHSMVEGEVVGLPDEVDGVGVIVTDEVRLCCPNRLDLYSVVIIDQLKCLMSNR